MHITRLSMLAAAAAFAMTASGCASGPFGMGGGSGSTGNGSAVSPGVSGIQWTATLQPMGGSSVGGNAILTPGGNSNQTTANISVSGGTSGGVYPWRIHRGSCGNDMGVVGAADLFPSLAAGTDGTARLMTTLPVATPGSGNFFVALQGSAGQPIACGNLIRGTR